MRRREVAAWRRGAALLGLNPQLSGVVPGLAAMGLRCEASLLQSIAAGGSNAPNRRSAIAGATPPAAVRRRRRRAARCDFRLSRDGP
jgi:hypothetical protein